MVRGLWLEAVVKGGLANALGVQEWEVGPADLPEMWLGDAALVRETGVRLTWVGH